MKRIFLLYAPVPLSEIPFVALTAENEVRDTIHLAKSGDGGRWI
jgi:hypothetical protein